MKTSTQKTVLWWLLALGLGGTVMYAGLVAELGFPTGGEAWINAWPVITGGMALSAGLILIRTYRREPTAAPGQWHLRMTDLLCAALIAGLIFTVFQQSWPDLLLRAGIPVGLVASTLFVAGVLTGARKGIQSGGVRAVFGLGYLLRLFGALGWAGVLCITTVAILARQDPIRLLADIILDEGGWNVGVIATARTSIPALPLGLLFCWLATRGLPKELSPPRKEDVTSTPSDGTNVGA